MKYFSIFFGKNTDCITTHNHLQPSNAGIGKRLKTARANDIIAPNAKNCHHKSRSNKLATTLTAPTGHDNPLSSDLTVVVLHEKKLAHRLPSFDKVTTHWL